MIQDTSRSAYEVLVKSGRAASQAEMVFMVIKRGAFPTNREIAKALDMEPGTVSARRGDLMRDNRITEALKDAVNYDPGATPGDP